MMSKKKVVVKVDVKLLGERMQSYLDQNIRGFGFETLDQQEGVYSDLYRCLESHIMSYVDIEVVDD